MRLSSHLIFIIILIGFIPLAADAQEQTVRKLTPQQLKYTNEWVKKDLAIQGEIAKADRQGDYARAVQWAKRGIELGSPAKDGKVQCGYCEIYYEEALLHGKGIKQDQHAAFLWFKERAKTDPGDALDCAELYADGIGTERDPVEAYAVLEWSYRIHFLTVDNSHFFERRSALKHRLRRELTFSQLREAEQRAKSRHPDLKWYD